MVSECFSENGTGNIQIMESRMNVEKLQDIFHFNLKESVAKLELSNEYIFQHDNDLKHTA